MIPYAVREKYISSDKLRVFDRLVTDLKAMPDLDPSNLVTCHAVCKALSIRHPTVRCVDGYFGGRGHNHSWLDLGSKILADMYPIAGAVPFLIDASHWIVPWNRLYIEDDSLWDSRSPSLQETEALAEKLVASLEDTTRATNWIDNRALELAQDVAENLKIDDPQWIARIQLGAIEGIKSELRNNSASPTKEDLIKALKSARGWVETCGESKLAQKDLKTIDALIYPD